AKAAASILGQRDLARLAPLIGPELDLGCGKPPVQVALTRDRPPVIEKDLDRPPIRDPGEQDQAFLEDLPERTRLEPRRHRLARDDAEDENGEADGERPAPDAKQLLELEPDLLRPIG